MTALACLLSDKLASAASSVWAVYIAILVCVVAWFAWPPTDPFNSAISDISLVLLFVLTRSGDRDTKAIRSGVKEAAKAIPGANEAVMD